MTDATGRRRARRVGVAAVLATAALATTACTSTEVPAPTIRVDRGPVATTVSASGKLVAITEQNLGFPEAGELAEINVKVGDRVETGQILARLDNFDLEQALEQGKAQLAQQQALLKKITGGNTVDAARADLDQARKILDATEEQVEATTNANSSATDRANTQLDYDRSVLDRAEHQLRDSQKACRKTPTPTTTPPPPTTTPESGSGSQAGSGSESESEQATPSGDTPTPSAGARGALFRGTGSDTTGSDTAATPIGTGRAGQTTPSAACEQVTADKTAVQQAKGTVIASETALDAAEEAENVDAAAGNLSIQNAKQTVITAENTLGTAESDTPADGAAQAALVRDAEATVALAQRDLDDTALRAPAAGIVSAVNGTTGEFIPATTGATALAPGSTARLPNVTDTSAATGATGAAGAAAAPGGGALIVLNDIDTIQLVVPFEESDAIRVAPNQPVEVAFDAIPDLTREATVLAIAPTGEEASGIVNYYATVVLTENDPRLRDGQTAEATVTVDTVDNTLRVPSAAITSGNTVSSPGSDGPVTTPFEPGRVGDEYTEVRTGLSEGQEILLPQAEVTASGPPAGPPPN